MTTIRNTRSKSTRHEPGKPLLHEALMSLPYGFSHVGLWIGICLTMTLMASAVWWWSASASRLTKPGAPVQNKIAPSIGTPDPAESAPPSVTLPELRVTDAEKRQLPQAPSRNSPGVSPFASGPTMPEAPSRNAPPVNSAGKAVDTADTKHETGVAMPPPPAGDPAEKEVALSVWAEKKVYRLGEHLRLSLQSSKDCYVFLYHQAADGKIQLIFPLDIDDDNFVQKDRVYSLPDPRNGVQFIIQPPVGTERIRFMATLEAKEARRWKAMDLTSLVSGAKNHREVLAYQVIE